MPHAPRFRPRYRAPFGGSGLDQGRSIRHSDFDHVRCVPCYLFRAHFELISPFLQPSRFVLVRLRLRLRNARNPSAATANTPTP